MSALENHLDRLGSERRWTYRASRYSSAEPAAWTTIALAAHGRLAEAAEPAKWLAQLQQPDGAVGINPDEVEPRWPTSLAMLAWHVVDRAANSTRFRQSIDLAIKWSLADCGETAPRSPEIGHDTRIVGWSWAAATHSWMEPTCFFVLALRAIELKQHVRTRDGIRLVRDRLLSEGGANYGNTIVMGQPLLPHIQPTGLAMLALASGGDADGRVEKSLRYLEESIDERTAPASLSFACLGLTAHNRRPSAATEWVQQSLEAHYPALSAYERSLLLLAALPDVSSWLKPARTATLADVPQ